MWELEGRVFILYVWMRWWTARRRHDPEKQKPNRVVYLSSAENKR